MLYCKTYYFCLLRCRNKNKSFPHTQKNIHAKKEKNRNSGIYKFFRYIILGIIYFPSMPTSTLFTMKNMEIHLQEPRLNLCLPPFSRCTPSSSCVKTAQEFHCHLCPLAVLFGRRDPGSQVLPLLLSFRQHQVVPGVQSFPGCPGFLLLHHGQVPQVIPACHAYRVVHLFRVVHHNKENTELDTKIKSPFELSASHIRLSRDLFLALNFRLVRINLGHFTFLITTL